MVLQSHGSILARSSGFNSTSINTRTANSRTNRTPNATMGNQRPVIDLLVAMIAVPIMILCALQLEKNLHDMTNSPESRWLVFALGIGMLIVSVIICGYVTHRMGVCIWTGPIDENGNPTNSRIVPHINSQNDILRIVDALPPSYESIVKCDMPPPPYDCLVIDIEPSTKDEPETSTKTTPAEVTTVHI